MSGRKWVCQETDNIKAAELAQRSGLHPFLIKILLSRGFESAGEMHAFLNDWTEAEYDPFLMKDMDLAVAVICNALENRQSITVYGDYDCDGITATAILVRFLKSIGGRVDYYIPDRITEGYGLSIAALETILNRGSDLIITVDCGITACKETAYIKSRGKAIVITDHHQCSAVIPAADAVINPHRPDCTYPFKVLAGVGVVYKLIQAICRKKDLGEAYRTYAEVVTLGTVADVVSITGENRNIVSSGLRQLAQTENPGMQALAEISGIAKYKITAQSFAFGLAPRMNAAGRMGNADIALQLMLAEDREEAWEIACLLDASNKQRQFVESDNMQTVLQILEQYPDIAERRILVVSSDQLHHGVAGIVAAKLAEQFHKPCILLVEEFDEKGQVIARGSARSFGSINLFALLSECKDLLTEFGGHALAAGMSLPVKHVAVLAERLQALMAHMDPEVFTQILKVDAELIPEEITVENINSMELLEPFGHNNENPVFISRNLLLKNVKALGAEGKHLKLFFAGGSCLLDAIAFHMGCRRSELEIGKRYDVVYHLENNEWKNQVTPQLKIIDLKEAEREHLLDRGATSVVPVDPAAGSDKGIKKRLPDQALEKDQEGYAEKESG